MNNKPCYFRDGQILYLSDDYGYEEFLGVYVNKKLWLYVIDSDYPYSKSIISPEDSPYDLGEYNLRSEKGDFTNKELNRACKSFESELGVELELIAGLGKDEQGDFCYIPKKKPNITNKSKRTYSKPKVVLHYRDGSHYILKNCTTVQVDSKVKNKYFIIRGSSALGRLRFTDDELEAITVIKQGEKKLITGDQNYFHHA